MRVIRPSALSVTERRRTIGLAVAMLVAGAASAALASTGVAEAAVSAVFAAVAAIGIGVGCAWLVRALRPNRTRELAGALVDRLGPALDDSYTLVLAPRLPLRDTQRLDGILVGPGGVRVFTGRSWEGRYRVRARTWEFDAGRREWIRCRTNPSYEAVALSEGFVRWAAERGFHDLPIKPVIAFPLRRSRLVLEEPIDEILTSDNAPWWANAIGRVRRLDPALASRLVDAVLDAAEVEASGRRRKAAPTGS